PLGDEESIMAIRDFVNARSRANIERYYQNPGHGLQAKQMDFAELADRVERHLAGKSGQTPQISSSDMAAIRTFYSDLRMPLNHMREVAKRVGVMGRDFILHNYTDRFIWDQALAMVSAYSFWYTRNTMKWAIRAMNSPGMMAGILRTMQELRHINADLPEWYQDTVRLKDVSGDYFFPIQSLFNPIYSFFGDKFRDADMRQTPIGEIINEGSQYGASPTALLNTGMAISATIRGENAEAQKWLGFIGGASKGLRALTVLARQAAPENSVIRDIIPPGGMGVEFWLVDQKNLGAEEGAELRFVGGPFERRRMGKAVWELMEEEILTQEEGYDAGYYGRGEAWDLGLQRASENTAKWDVLGWLSGSGLRGRSQVDIDVFNIDKDVRTYYTIKD
ncbi:hypothetical protein LCGC14_2875560, partial [marine sediment metagenome]